MYNCISASTNHSAQPDCVGAPASQSGVTTTVEKLADAAPFLQRQRITGDRVAGGNLKVTAEFNKATRLFLISHAASRIFQHGGGSSGDRRSSQSAPDIRETCRLLQRLTDGLHPAPICRSTVSGQPGVVGLRLQHLGWAAGTKKTEAHTLESGRESTSQVSFRKIIIKKYHLHHYI